MARHAGFAVVAAMDEDTVNKVLDSYARSLGPFVFPLPQTIAVLGASVSFSGVVEMDPPTVELHANPADLVTVHFTLRSKFLAQVTDQPQQVWKTQFTGTVSTGLVTVIVKNQVIAGLNVSTITFQPLQVQQLAGPPLPGEILAALQSPTFAAVATAFVNTLPPLTLSLPLVPSRIKNTVPAPKNVPVFDWFTVDLTASRVVIRPLEGAIVAAVDFAGFSQGDPSQLVDLTRVGGVGSTYVSTITPETDLNVPPVLVKRTEIPGGQVASVLNMTVLSAIVAAQVSPQISGSRIANQVLLNDVEVRYSAFEKPLRGPEDGLQIAMGVTAKGVDASIYLMLQAFLQTYDGPTQFIQDDSWHFLVGQIDVHVSMWLEFLIGSADAGWLVGAYVLAMLAMVTGEWKGQSGQGFFEDVISSVDSLLAKIDTGNLGADAEGRLQTGAYGVDLPRPWFKPLPSLVQPNWNGMLRNVSFTRESVDLALALWPDPNAAAQPMAVFSTASWPAYKRQPFSVTLKLRDDWEKLAASPIMLVWEVRRADTNELVVSATKRYDDPSGNGVSIPHHSEALYTVEEYAVLCTVTLTTGGQTGEVWSGQQSIPILDALDRSRNYVEWGPHIVHILAPGPVVEYWNHVRRSRIHRTAVAARCKMLWQRLTGMQPGHHDEFFHYRDTLPFPLSELNQNRKILCEYCFFGGPDKFTPFPQENWFEPYPQLIGIG